MTVRVFIHVCEYEHLCAHHERQVRGQPKLLSILMFQASGTESRQASWPVSIRDSTVSTSQVPTGSLRLQKLELPHLHSVGVPREHTNRSMLL